MIKESGLKKRDCRRFNVPGTTLQYKSKSSFFKKTTFSTDHFPVINISKGGAQFLCNERLQAGKHLTLSINIPGQEAPIEIFSNVRWIAKNREQSYKYQTGVAFQSYGKDKEDNPVEILTLLEQLEKKAFNIP